MVGANVKPKAILKESLDRQAASYLRDAILKGVLVPGERLTEQALSEMLGISRGTIRASLHRLVSEGLVTQKIYSNWEVMALSSRDANELFRLRASLEGLAGEIVAEHITDEQKAKLSDSYSALLNVANLGDADQLAEADLSFHRTILELTNNARLISHYGMVERPLRVYIRAVNVLLETPSLVATSHAVILKAIKSGDPIVARRELESHILESGERLVRKLTSESVVSDYG